MGYVLVREAYIARNDASRTSFYLTSCEMPSLKLTDHNFLNEVVAKYTHQFMQQYMLFC